jgi:hypothetical protein
MTEAYPKGKEQLLLDMLPRRATELIEGKKALAHLTLSGDGLSISMSVVGRHPRLGLYPHNLYSMENFLDLTSKIVVDPIEPKPGNPNEPGGGDDNGHKMTLDDARRMDAKRELRKFKAPGSGVWNTLASDSLSFIDLARKNPKELQARAFLVAEKIGTPKLISKIRGDRFYHLGDELAEQVTMFEYWSRATPLQRWCVLTTRSKRAFMGDHVDTLTDSQEEKIRSLDCPFRDSQEIVFTKTDSIEEEDGFTDLDFSDLQNEDVEGNLN